MYIIFYAKVFQNLYSQTSWFGFFCSVGILVVHSFTSVAPGHPASRHQSFILSFSLAFLHLPPPMSPLQGQQPSSNETLSRKGPAWEFLLVSCLKSFSLKRASGIERHERLSSTGRVSQHPCLLFLCQVLDVPLTVKIRTGVQEKVNLAHKIIPSIREWGASLVTVSSSRPASQFIVGRPLLWTKFRGVGGGNDFGLINHCTVPSPSIWDV